MVKKKPVILILLAVALLGANPFAHSANFIQEKGVSNFCKVSDDLYRCAQPTLEGMENLKAMGVKTIINLSTFRSDLAIIGNTGLGYEKIPMVAWPLVPLEKHVIKFLSIVTDRKRTPVVIHCQHGADRTGTMCAVYRIVVQGWTKDEAIKEMIDGGFGFHKAWGNNLIQWLKDLDVEKVKQKAGIRLNRESVAGRQQGLHSADSYERPTEEKTNPIPDKKASTKMNYTFPSLSVTKAAKLDAFSCRFQPCPDRPTGSNPR